MSRNGAVDRRLAVRFCGIDFQNPVLLAAGTAAYGEELDEVVQLDRLGGIITKAVSLEPRHGAPSPRVAEFDGALLGRPSHLLLEQRVNTGRGWTGCLCVYPLHQQLFTLGGR